MIGTRAILLAVLALALGALRVGYGWGRGAQADRVTVLTRDNATLQGQLESCRQTADQNAANLIAVRGTLARELTQRQALHSAQEAELAARAQQIAALTAAAKARKQSLLQQAAADEKCAALRDLPVCTAVADRLWGDAAGAGTH